MNKGTIIFICVLICLYIFLFSLGSRGWGYAGYRGFMHGPSFFYWGGAKYYPGYSVRHGSVGGRGVVGGGPGSGK